jgi:hypothetical protein
MRLAVLGTAFSLSVAEADALAVCTTPGDPDCVDLLESFGGAVDFFATGGSFTVNDDPDDRPDRVIETATVAVPERRIPARAELVRAFLYFGGSLYLDGDGIETPDMSVEVQVPGSDFMPVTGDQVYQSGAIPGFPEVTLYSVRADITELMRQAGGRMVGTYRVRGFASDIFDEASEHTAANASFSIILIFEEPRLPKRRIVLFDGMQEVLGSTISLPLSGFIVSPVPSGALTMYALEGDCNPGPDACDVGDNKSGLERINVIGEDPSRTLVLTDGLNPPNDIFNRTINTVDPPIANIPGTDIDTFDITPVLRAADEAVTVEVTSPLPANGNSGELVGLAYVIVGIDVFAPELEVDSRIEITTARGERLPAYYPGDPLRVTFALSNTGNLPGTEVTLATDLPANATQFVVDRVPKDATETVDLAGGAALRGKVTVEGISVRHGEIEGLVLLVETTCPLPEGGTFAISGDVGAPREGGVPFTLTASVALLPREVCGPRFFLFGGGGCSAAGTEVSLLLLIAVVVLLARRRSAAAGILAVTVASWSCDSVETEPDRPAPLAIGVECPGAPDMIQVGSIGGRDPFCVDRYEASIASGSLGNASQPIDGDGSTTAQPASKRFVQPATGVTWFQARAACGNAGKRLCTSDEWTTACRGADDLTYPYGDAYERNVCNGFDATRAAPVETGAMIIGIDRPDGQVEARGCVSADGAYDLSGNVWEWNETGYFDDSRRGLAGGGFRSNRIGLRCVTQDNHAPPDELNDGFGFRCCKDFPTL